MTIHLQLPSFHLSTVVLRDDFVRTKTVKNMSSLLSQPLRHDGVFKFFDIGSFHCCHSNPIVYQSLVPDFLSRLAFYNQARLFICLFVHLFIYLLVCFFGDFLFVYLCIRLFVTLFTYLPICL